MKFINWLTQYNKAFVAIIMVLVYLLNKKYGIELPVDDQTATVILGMLISALTYVIPNSHPEGTVLVNVQDFSQGQAAINALTQAPPVEPTTDVSAQ